MNHGLLNSLAEPRLLTPDLTTELHRLAPSNGHKLVVVSFKLLVEERCAITLVSFHLVSHLILSKQFVLSDLTARMPCQHVVVLVLDEGRVCKSLEQPLAIVKLAHRAELALWDG